MRPCRACVVRADRALLNWLECQGAEGKLGTREDVRPGRCFLSHRYCGSYVSGGVLWFGWRARSALVVVAAHLVGGLRVWPDLGHELQRVFLLEPGGRDLGGGGGGGEGEGERSETWVCR